MLTIDDLIQQLIDAKQDRNNKLRGNAVVHLCVPEQGYLPLIDTKMEPSADGAVMLVFVQDGTLAPTVVPNVIIDVEGGVVTSVDSDFPVRYLLLDQDNISAGGCDPGWSKSEEDYKRVSVLLDDPTAEIDKGFELVVVRYNAIDHATYMARLKEVTGLEPVSVTNLGATDDVLYEFADVTTANAVMGKIVAAKLEFVLSLFLHGD